jgi:hypothetical protein
LLDADADRADLELRLIKLLLKDRAAVHPFAGNGGSWRKAVIKHRPIGAQTPRGTQINAARTRQNEHRAKHKFGRTLTKAAVLEKMPNSSANTHMCLSCAS